MHGPIADPPAFAAAALLRELLGQAPRSPGRLCGIVEKVSLHIAR